MKQKILLPALLAAMLVIAGCGGGNSTVRDPGGGENPPDAALTAAITEVLALKGSPDETDATIRKAIDEFEAAEANNSGADPANLAEAKARVEVLENQLTARDTAKDSELLNALQTAVDELEKRSGGETVAGSVWKALDDAMKKGTAVGALGSSAVVEKYGDAVLKARDDLKAALDDAKAKRGAVTGDLATGSAGKSLLDTAKSAIDKAESDLADGKTPGVIRGEIARDVAAYEGKDNTPAEKASKVAKVVFDHLITASPLMAGNVAALNMAKTAETAFATGNTASSSVVAFEAIFGTDKNDAGKTRFSLNGVTTLLVTGPNGVDLTSEIAAIAAGTAYSESGQPTAVEYLGIAGNVYCYDADCSAPADDTFGAGWHFVPSDGENSQYVWASDDEGNYMYEPARYVEWGLWITDGDGIDSDNTVGEIDAGELRNFVGLVNAESLETRNETRNNMSLAAYEDDNGETKATYTGAAAGLSARKMGTGDDATYASGHFVANVTLNASFKGADSALSGTIGNFRPADGEEGTNHVDSAAWSITLRNVPLTIPSSSVGGTDDDPGESLGTGVAGNLTVNAYRKTAVDAGDHHPEGFFGQFNARFYDEDDTTVTGAAAGNYHAD